MPHYSFPVYVFQDNIVLDINCSATLSLCRQFLVGQGGSMHRWMVSQHGRHAEPPSCVCLEACSLNSALSLISPLISVSLLVEQAHSGHTALSLDRLEAAERAGPLPFLTRVPAAQGRPELLRYPVVGGWGRLTSPQSL